MAAIVSPADWCSASIIRMGLAIVPNGARGAGALSRFAAARALM